METARLLDVRTNKVEVHLMPFVGTLGYFLWLFQAEIDKRGAFGHEKLFLAPPLVTPKAMTNDRENKHVAKKWHGPAAGAFAHVLRSLGPVKKKKDSKEESGWCDAEMQFLKDWLCG